MPLVFAHLGSLLEPLLFLPAFLAVIAATVSSLRHRGAHDRTRNRSIGAP